MLLVLLVLLVLRLLLVPVLRRVFKMFDSAKSGKIETEKVRTILITIMGHNFDDEKLEVLLEEEPQDGRQFQPILPYYLGM